MPRVGDPPVEGRIIRTYRLPLHSIDVDEPLVDVQVGRHVLQIRSQRDGVIYTILSVGQDVNAGTVRKYFERHLARLNRRGASHPQLAAALT